MAFIIIIFGAFVLLAGVVILVNPELVIGSLKNNLHNPAIHISAVVGRLVIGAVLVIESDHSKFPLTVAVIGWLLVFAAIFFALIGGYRFRKLVSRVLEIASSFARVGGIFAALFGGFLIYAFI